MNEINYKWKMEGLARGVDPSIALQELNRIQDLYGSVTPEIVVNESKNPGSPLYPIIFKHEDKKAAYLYRLELARKLINNIHLTIIRDGEVKEIAVFEVTTLHEGYKNINSFNPDDVEFIKNAVYRQLNILKLKLLLYKEFKNTIKLIEAASDSLKKLVDLSPNV